MPVRILLLYVSVRTVVHTSRRPSPNTAVHALQQHRIERTITTTTTATTTATLYCTDPPVLVLTAGLSPSPLEAFSEAPEVEPRPGRGRRDRLRLPSAPSFCSDVGEFAPCGECEPLSDFPSSSDVHFEDIVYRILRVSIELDLSPRSLEICAVPPSALPSTCFGVREKCYALRLNSFVSSWRVVSIQKDITRDNPAADIIR